MTLEHLVAELQALSLAYPPETQVYLADENFEVIIQSVEVQSHSGGIEIHLKG